MVTMDGMAKVDRDELLRIAAIRHVLSLSSEQLSAVVKYLEHFDVQADRERTPLSEWIPLEEAAPRLGRTRGHLSRLCRLKLGFEDKARVVKPAVGKPIWFIRRSYDPRLEEQSAPRAARFSPAAGENAVSLASKPD